LQAGVAAKQAQLAATHADLVRARDRLTRLENRQRDALDALRRNLVADYTNPRPDIVAVIVSARKFSDLLEDASFVKRVAHQNAKIMDAARISKRTVTREADALIVIQARDAQIAAALGRQRDSAQTLESALLNERARRL